jgi:hypothetical protein
MAKISGKLPPALQSQPEIDPILVPYFRAFFSLSSVRGNSMGAELPLTPSEILAYATIHCFLEDLQFFYRVVTESDSVFFEHLAEKQKAKGSTKPKKSSGQRK